MGFETHEYPHRVTRDADGFYRWAAEMTYKCAVKEMPVGYADALMSASPIWTLPVVIAIGIVLSVLVFNLTAKIFKIEK